MHHQQGAHEEVLGDEIAVGDGIHAVGRGHGEAEFGGEQLAVNRETRARQRARARADRGSYGRPRAPSATGRE
jgi:hypothetical protein